MSHIASIILDIRYFAPFTEQDHDVLISLKAGESLALRGANQSGKTRMMNAIAGLTDFDEGTIWLEGQNFSDLSKEGRRRLRHAYMGVSVEPYPFVQEFTAMENLELAYFAQSREKQSIKSGESKAHIHELLTDFELSHCEYRKLKYLSASEIARLSIARAFLGKKPVIVIDDPGAQLDPLMKKIIYDQIFHYQKLSQSALILTTSESYLSSRCDHCFDLQTKSWVR